MFHVAGGADAFLDDHAVIVMSDHSQTAVEDRINLADLLSGFRVLAPGAGMPTGRRRGLPVGALGAGLRARSRPSATPSCAAAGRHRGRRSTGSTSSPGARAARASCDPAAAYRGRGHRRAALLARRRPARPARRHLGSRGRRPRAGARHRPTGASPAAPTRTRSSASGRALTCPTAGDLLVSAAPGYEFVDWGGCRPRRRRQPRLAAPRRLARHADLLRDRSRLARRARAVDDRRCNPADRAATSGYGDRLGHARRARTTGCTCGVRARLAQAAQLGPARASSCWSALSGYVVNLAVFTFAVEGRSDVHHIAAATLAFVGRGDQQLLVEPALDVRRAATVTPASRPRASSRSA